MNQSLGRGEEDAYKLTFSVDGEVQNLDQAKEIESKLLPIIQELGLTATAEVTKITPDNTAEITGNQLNNAERKLKKSDIFLDKNGEILSDDEQDVLYMSRRGFIDRYSKPENNPASNPKALKIVNKFNRIRGVQDILAIGRQEFLNSEILKEGGLEALEAMDKALQQALPNLEWYEVPTPEDNAKICTDLNHLHEAVLPGINLQRPEMNDRTAVGSWVREAERNEQRDKERASNGKPPGVSEYKQPDPKVLEDYVKHFQAARAVIEGE